MVCLYYDLMHNTLFKITLRRYFLLAVLLIFIMPLHVWPYTADVHVLTQDTYFTTVYKKIMDARYSVYVFMPEMSMKKDSPASRLLDALIEMRRKERIVHVYLDSDSANDIVPGGKLYPLYQKLKQAKIEIFFDSPDFRINNRLIIIDKEIIVGGSISWSPDMDKNYETGFLIKSPEAASALLERVRDIPTTSTPLKKRSKNFAYVPVSFIATDGALGKMIQKNDEAAFDAYMSLLRDFDGRKVNTDFKKIAAGMGLSRNVKGKQLKNRVRMVLKKLNKTYRVIRIRQTNHKGLEIKIIQNPGESVVWFPKTYWKSNWHKTLPFYAKTFFLINLNEISFSKNIFDWKSTPKGIAEKYPLNLWSINNGIIELCRYNILEFRSVELKSQNNNSIIWFQYNGLFDLNKFHIKLKKLSSVHDDKKLFRARNYAAFIYKKYDISAIEYIIAILNTHDDKNIKDVFNQILSSTAISPKRRLGYLQKRLRAE